MEEIEEDEPSEVNLENNLSDKVFEQESSYRPRYGGGGRSGYGGGGGGRRPYRSDSRGYSGRGQRRRY